MNRGLRATALASMIVLALAACTPSGPTDPSSFTSDDASPSASTGAADASPGAFDLDEVRSTLSSLAATAPFEWTGGTAETYPANAQIAWEDTTVKPLACAPFYNLGLLQFRDDRELAPADAIVTKSLSNKAGAGPDDDEFLATVSVRVLDSPSRGVGDGIDALTGVADACSGGYVATDNVLGTDMENVTKFEPLALPDALPDGVSAVAYVADTAGSFATPQTVWAWIAVDNLLIAVNYYVDPDIDGASVDDAQAVVASVIDEFAAASAA